MKKSNKYYLALSLLTSIATASASNGTVTPELQGPGHSRQNSLSQPASLDADDRKHIADMSKKLDEMTRKYLKGISIDDFTAQIKPESITGLLRKLKLNESLSFDEIANAAQTTFPQEKLSLSADLHLLKNKLVEHTGDHKLVFLIPSLVSAIWSLTLILPPHAYCRADHPKALPVAYQSASVLFAKALSQDIKDYISSVPGFYLRLHSHAVTFLSYYIEEFPLEAAEVKSSLKN